MEVILLDDVERVGHEGDIVRVADGYARNYLVPRGLAVLADRANRKQLEGRRRAIERREGERAQAALRRSGEFRQRLLTIHARGGEGGKLHGSVTTQHIAEALREQHGIAIDRRHIELPEAIRTVGDYLVSVQLYKGVRAEIPVKVLVAMPDEPKAQPPGAQPSAAPEAEAPEQPTQEDQPAAETDSDSL